MIARNTTSIVIRLLLCIFFLTNFLVNPHTSWADSRETDVIGHRTLEKSSTLVTQAPSISANYAYIVDSKGKVYFQRDPDKKTHIASITKIMTALVALTFTTPDMLIYVSENAASTGESTAQLWTGDVLTLKNALIGLMVPSGNDAAVAIAEAVGQVIYDRETQGIPIEIDKIDIFNDAKDASSLDSDKVYLENESILNSIGHTKTSPIQITDPEIAYNKFIDTMNALASKIGCTNTLFANPHGLDEGEFEGEMYSTARDVTIISSKAMQFPLFAEIVGSGNSAIEVTRGTNRISIPLISTDVLLNRYVGACGIKTGFTDSAGSCFAGASDRNNVFLYAAILDAENNDRRFMDAEILFNWVYNSYNDINILSSEIYSESECSSTNENVALIANIAHSQWSDKLIPISLQNPNSTVSASSIFGNISQNIVITRNSGNIKAGDVIGRIDIYQHNEIIASENLIACKNVDQPNLFEEISLMWKKFIKEIPEDNSSLTEIYNELPILIQKA